MLSTTVEAWGAPPTKVFKPAGGGEDTQVLCVSQMVCDTAEDRWLNRQPTGEEGCDSECSETNSSDPESSADVEWTDNIKYVPMDGNIQPSNWSGECKYNFMNPEKYKEEPGLCKRNFGWPATFNELVLRITTIWFPWVKCKRSGQEKTATLTALEECLATLYFLKHASKSNDQKHLRKVWGISKYK